MTVEMTPEERTQRAERAKQILADKLVREALDGIRADIVANWQKVPLKDSELKEKFHMLYGVVDRFEAALRSHIEDGQVADFELARKKRFGVF